MSGWINSASSSSTWHHLPKPWNLFSTYQVPTFLVLTLGYHSPLRNLTCILEFKITSNSPTAKAPTNFGLLLKGWGFEIIHAKL